MEIEKTKKQLNLISRLFILLGAIDLVICIVDNFIGDHSLAEFGLDEESTRAIMQIVVIGIMIMLLLAFSKLYLGIAGIKQVKGSLTGKVHITLAKIWCVVYACALLGQIFMFVATKSFDFVDMCKPATGIIFAVYYVKYATEIYNYETKTGKTAKAEK